MKKLFISALISLIPLVYALWLLPSMPDSIATHYNIHGEADRFGSKYEILIIALLPLIISIVFYIVNKIDPKNMLQNMGGKFEWMILALTVCISIFSFYLVYKMASNSSQLSINYMFGFIGLLFIVLGNYMPAMRPNYFIGIRTPWTLENEEVWRLTHSLGGKYFLVAGILLLLLSFIPMMDEIKIGLMMGILIICSAIPMIYSYIKFNELKNSKK